MMSVERQKYIEFKSVEEALSHSPPFDIVQLKYDGIWCRLEVNKNPAGDFDNVAVWYSRTGEEKHRAGGIKLPIGTYFGEFMFGSHWSQHPDRNGKTYLFDIIRDGDRDISGLEYARRHSIIVSRCPTDKQAPIQAVANVHISLAASFWNRVLVTRSEGLVFRHSNAGYDDILGRLKRKVEVDYVVLDIVEGQGKHVGRLGAIVCGLYIKGKLVEVCAVGGGLSDRDRNDIWNAWPRDRQKVITISGRGQFPSGAVRHPNFVRFRDDKRPEECIWETPPE